MSKKPTLALIGSPLQYSRSDIYHNYLISRLNIDAHYAKFDVTVAQLPAFLEQAKAMKLRGLSVTMPLKEAIIPLLDDVHIFARLMGAVNTVKFENGKSYGYNTDYHGAMTAIRRAYPHALQDKKVVIVGAGGVAKAIAFGLRQLDARMIIMNRTIEKAQELAQTHLTKAVSLSRLKYHVNANCSLLIQATSVGMHDKQVIIKPEYIPTSVAVMDVVSAPQNHWLDKLAERGCLTISGKQFWIYQAIEQYREWFNAALDLSLAPHIFEQAFTETCLH